MRGWLRRRRWWQRKMHSTLACCLGFHHDCDGEASAPGDPLTHHPCKCPCHRKRALRASNVVPFPTRPTRARHARRARHVT